FGGGEDQGAVQGEDGVERFSRGVFERRLQAVCDLAARGGGGVVEADAEAEHQAPGNALWLGGDGVAVVLKEAGDFRLAVRVDLAREVAGRLAHHWQQ